MHQLPPERSTGFLWRWCTLAREFMAAMIIRPSADITPEYVGPFGVLLHLTKRGKIQAAEVFEWDTEIESATVTARGGQVKYSAALIGADADYTCDLSTITDGETWFLFVEINIGAGTVELKVQSARPVDDPANSIIRTALSIWARAGDVYTRTRILHRGAIQLSGIWNQ
jgi:hypothetical protein